MEETTVQWLTVTAETGPLQRVVSTIDHPATSDPKHTPSAPEIASVIAAVCADRGPEGSGPLTVGGPLDRSTGLIRGTARLEKPRPQDGDVLVSRLTARVGHQVAIVPARTGSVCPNGAAAIAEGVQLARDRQVAAWLTQDHRHFLKIASFRLETVERTGSSHPR